MAQAGLGEEALRQGSQEARRRCLSRIPSSQPQLEAARRGQQTWARAAKAWSRGWGVRPHLPQPLATSVPSCQLYQLPTAAELPGPKGGLLLGDLTFSRLVGPLWYQSPG